MNIILNMVRMHLQLVARDRSTLVQAFIVPVILMVVLGVAINEDQAVEVTLLVDVVNEDRGQLADELIATLQQTADDVDAVLICVYGMDDNPEACDLESNDRFDEIGTERLEDLTSSALLRIPEGFSDALSAGEGMALEYRSDSSFGNQSVARTTVDTALSRFNGSLGIASQGVETVEAYFTPYDSTEARADDYRLLLEQSRVELQAPPAVLQAISTEEEEIVGLGNRQSVPGQGSMFVLFSLLAIATYMVEERNDGTLKRLFVVPTARFNIVFGKILGVFVFGMLQFGIFIGVGMLLGIDWGNDYLALFLLIAAYCLAGTALGFLISTFTRTINQAANAALMFGLLLAPLGGAWWPLSIVPDFMRTIGHLSPIAWVMEGFYELLYYEGTLADVLPMIGVLLAFAAVFTTVAVFRFRYE